MNKKILKKHIENYKKRHEKQPDLYTDEENERNERLKYYQLWDKDNLLKMNQDDFHEYISKLWALMIWGNKKYVIGKIIQDNGLDKVKKYLIKLLWDNSDIEQKWDEFRDNIKGFGPAMISELLYYCHPDEYMILNRKAITGLKYLEVEDLPIYNYQYSGKKFKELSNITKEIVDELKNNGYKNANLYTVDYFIWDELQIETTDIQISKNLKDDKLTTDDNKDDYEFIHDEVKDKIADIGEWLGFTTSQEIKIAEGAKVDTIWEATIGNMGRVIYVFEVQTKGSIDSLILNLLKALNNPAVQGVVAVSDEKQLEKIMQQAKLVTGLDKKLKYWNYIEVLKNHDALSMVNESINKLGLVPQGF